MTNEKKFRKMQKALFLLGKEMNETAGALGQLEMELRKNHKCKNLKEAKKKRKKLKKKKLQLKATFNEHFEKFEKKFGKLVRAIEKKDPDIHNIAKRCLPDKKKGKARSKKAKKGSS